MLNVNNKMYLNKRFTAVDVEFNTMREIVLAHILAHSYQIADTHIEDIEFDDVLYISDKHIENRTLLLESNDFREAGVTMARQNFPKRVRTCHAYEFNELSEDLLPYREGINLIVIGYINTIPEHIFENIKNFFGSTMNIVIFGDPLVDAPENNSYFMPYLSNASVTIKLEYDSYRKSDKKKINNTLIKLRKDVTSLVDITNSNHVNVKTTSVIDVDSIIDYINNFNNLVVLPKRFYAIVNSRIFQSATQRSNLNFEVGDQFILKHTWTFKQDGKNYVVPPLVLIRLMNIKGELNISGHRCIVCDVSVKDPNTDNPPMLVMDAVIDYTDYLFSFDQSQHPDNMEDYNDIVANINRFNSIIHDSSVAKVMFCNCVTSDMAKYYDSKYTLAYIETIERDGYYSSDFNWYKIFCNTLDGIDIVVTDEFTDVTY